jgi:hypothetical protein
MADYVTDGKIGIDLTATYASTSAGFNHSVPCYPWYSGEHLQQRRVYVCPRRIHHQRI